jgi:hypothetical protein
MKTLAKHGSSAIAILVALVIAALIIIGCEDFGSVLPPTRDAGGVPSTLLSCRGTEPNPDVTCTGGAKNGSICTIDCCYPAALPTSCGIDKLGYRTCTCPNGVYEWCACTPPVAWPTLPAGGDCSPQGSSVAAPAGLGGAACTKEWTTCFTFDSKGCVCLKDATTGRLNLHCGSQGTWFLRVPGVTTAY